MSIGLKLLITIFLGGFSVIIFYFSLELIRTKSLRTKLDDYEKNPESRTLIRKWLFGWVLDVQRSLHRSIIQGNGDKLFTIFIRTAGVFFLIFTIALWAYLVFIWVIGPY